MRVHLPQRISRTIPAPINTPHKRLAAPQPFVNSAANLPLIIFLAMIDDAYCLRGTDLDVIGVDMDPPS
jgi:hypothetical protein